MFADRQAAAGTDADPVHAAAAGDIKIAAGIDRRTGDFSARTDFDHPSGIDRGTDQRTAGIDLDTSVRIQREVARRRAGMDRGGCFGKNQTGKGIGYKFAGIVSVKFNISAVFHDIRYVFNITEFIYGQSSPLIDSQAVRRDSPVYGKRSAGIDHRIVRGSA